MKHSERISMRCPSCHGGFIFIGSGGYLTCSYVDCPEPDVAKKVEQIEASLTSARAIMQKFVDKVDRGVFNRVTYAEMKQWMEGKDE